MLIYVASKYIDNKIINANIAKVLRDNGYDVFLPMELNISAKDPGEKNYVATECYKAIIKSDVILAVFPIGDSVTAEIGAVSILKVLIPNHTKLVFYNPRKEDIEKKYAEVMIEPFVDKIVYNNCELLEYLKDII